MYKHQVITGSTTKLFLWVSTALEMEETHKKKAEHIVETYSIFHCLWPDVLVLIASGSLSKSLM